jgi:hypothetical protein
MDYMSLTPQTPIPFLKLPPTKHAVKEIFSASAISGDVGRLNKSLPIFMGRFLIDPLAKINLVTAKNSN